MEKEEILHLIQWYCLAGAIGSVLLILRKIGIDAGRELLFDPFVSVGRSYKKTLTSTLKFRWQGLVAGKKTFVLVTSLPSFIPSKIGGC